MSLFAPEDVTFENCYNARGQVTRHVRECNGMLPNGITNIVHACRGYNGSGGTMATLPLVFAAVVAIILRLPAASCVWLRRSHS